MSTLKVYCYLLYFAFIYTHCQSFEIDLEKEIRSVNSLHPNKRQNRRNIDWSSGAPIKSECVGDGCYEETSVCSQYIVGVNDLPCAKQEKRCKEISVGFLCLSTYDNSTLINTTNIKEYGRCNAHLCPSSYKCMFLDISRDNYQCSYDKEHGLIPAFNNTSQELGSYKFDDNYCERLCQHGAGCKKKKCSCLMHYTGKYCEKEIDYCTSNPCLQNAPCKSNFGGYTCECPRLYRGKHCEKRTRYPVKPMKMPNFLYDIKQYTEEPNYYRFYVTSLGVLPRISINFGDGTEEIKAVKQNFTLIKRDHFNMSFPPIHDRENDIYTVVLQHVYNRAGLYRITVEAANRNYITFQAQYNVAVRESKAVHLSAELWNCADKEESESIFERKDQIVILTRTKVDNSNVKPTFSWSIDKNNEYKKANEIAEELNNSNIERSKSHLVIYPFTLPLGRYTVRVRVNLSVGNNGTEVELITWFNIIAVHLIPKLNVASIYMEFRQNNNVVLNASSTHDYNLAPDKQVSLINHYHWSCKFNNRQGDNTTDNTNTRCSTPISTYCNEKRLPETGPILTIPHKQLDNACSYTVNLGLISDQDSNNISIVIQTVAQQTPIIRINCLYNCGVLANPDDVIALEATCISCPDDNDDFRYTWQIITLPGSQGNVPIKSIDESQTELGLNNKLLIVKQGLFHSFAYKFVVNGNSQSLNISSTRVDFGSAEQVIEMNFPITIGECTIEPESGYSLITSFTITCNDFDSDTLLTYDVKQYQEIHQGLVGVVRGYNTDPVLKDVRLAAGTADSDYKSTVRITVTNTLGIFSRYDLNVTVLPLIFLKKEPYKLLDQLSSSALGDSSLLAMKQASNSGDVVKIIQAIAITTLNYIQSDSARYLNREDLSLTVDLIKSSLISYLIKQPIMHIYSLNHYSYTFGAVLHLPSVKNLPETTKIGAEILKKIVTQIQHLLKNNVVIYKPNMLSLGQSILIIASALFKNSLYYYSLNRPKPHAVHDSNEYFIVKEFFEITEEEMFYRSLNGIFSSISTFVKLFMAYKVKEEKETVIYALGASLLVKKGSTERMNETVLEVKGHGQVSLLFTAKKPSFYSMFALFTHNNPYWQHMLPMEINSPLVSIQVYNDQGKRTTVSGQVELLTTSKMSKYSFQGKLNIRPHWLIQDSDVEVSRVQAPQGGKVRVQFSQAQYKLRVLIKKGVRPEKLDFWKKAITVPQNITGVSIEGMYTVSSDEQADYDGEFFYIGILPHTETLRELVKEENAAYNLFPENFAGEYDSIYSYDDDIPTVNHIRESPNKVIDYQFEAFYTRCLTWQEDTMVWSPDCEIIRGSKYYDNVVCDCNNLTTVTAGVYNIRAEHQPFHDDILITKFDDNLTLIVTIICLLILLLGFLIWARMTDTEDLLKRDVIYLTDNESTDSYVYIVIVQTGRRLRAGTTSHVAIQLVGDVDNSRVHILTDSHRPVLCRGTQDWFMLKTKASLGDIAWINLWHDHTGSNPDWYCDKVIVHNIQTHQIWFFVTEEWLSPLYGDGSISCTVHKTVDNVVFEKGYRFRECFFKQFDEGYHGWVSMFHKHIYSNYTRCERVLVSFTQISMIMVMVAHMYDYPEERIPSIRIENNIESSHVRNFTYLDIWYAFIIAAIVFPLNFILQFMFRCTTPKPYWGDSPIYHRGSLIIDFDRELDNSPKKSLLKGKSSHTAERLNYIVGNLNGKKSSVGLDVNTKGMIGKRSVEENYLLPNWFFYVVWIISILVISVCCYFTIFYGICYGSSLTVCYFITLMFAVMFSMIFETAKLMIMALYNSTLMHRETSIEDRSELVHFIEARTKEEQSHLPNKTQLKELRTRPMYKPIPRKRTELLETNALMAATARSFVMDLGIFLLFLIILNCIIFGIRDSKSYHQVSNINNMLNRGENGNIEQKDVRTMDSFIDYMCGTFTANIYKVVYYNGRPSLEEGLTADSTNYLIGVPRLRQIRDSEESCAKLEDNFTSCDRRYKMKIDEKNYGQSWQKLINENDTVVHFEPVKSIKGLRKTAWIHHSGEILGTAYTTGKISTYPGGGYEVLLGRTSQVTRKTLEYLEEKLWFDSHTRVIIVEFALYNPNRHLVSIIKLLAERTSTGNYEVKTNIDTVKVRPISSTGEIFVVMMFFSFVILMLIFIEREGRVMAKLRSMRYIDNFWLTFRIILTLLGIMAIILYLGRTFKLTSAIESLQYSDDTKFIDFYPLLCWDEWLIAVTSVMVFLVILAVCHLFSVRFKVQLMITVIKLSSFSICCYTFVFLFIVFAFVWTGYLLLLSTSEQFHTLLRSLISVVSIIVRLCPYHASNRGIGVTSWMDLSYLGIVYYFTAFFTLILLSRWGFSVLLMRKFTNVMKFAKLHYQQPIINSHMGMKLASEPYSSKLKLNRDYINTLNELYKSSSETLPKRRLEAMEELVAKFCQLSPTQEMIDSEIVPYGKHITMAATTSDFVRKHMQKSHPNRLGAASSSVHPQMDGILTTFLKISNLENKMKKLYDTVADLNREVGKF